MNGEDIAQDMIDRAKRMAATPPSHNPENIIAEYVECLKDHNPKAVEIWGEPNTNLLCILTIVSQIEDIKAFWPLQETLFLRYPQVHLDFKFLPKDRLTDDIKKEVITTYYPSRKRYYPSEE